MKRVSVALIVVLLLCVVSVAITPIPGCGHLIRVEIEEHRPKSITCENAEVIYFGSPFYGWPVPGADWGNITAYFCDPVYYEIFGQIHWGIDIAVPGGTPVVSTVHRDLEAVVVRAGYDWEMGFNVKICVDGWCAIYMHLEDIAVHVGGRVSRGTVLGWVDNTGFSTGPHLHYQINAYDIPVDPAIYLLIRDEDVPPVTNDP